MIADDHPAIRLGVRMALISGGFRVVGEAADADGVVSAVLRECPDVCLLDVRMPGGGIEAARRLAEAESTTRVVMLTVSTSTDDVLAALRAGAVGYLPKDTSPDRLPAALCGVLKGEAALPRALVGMVLHEFRDYTEAVADPVRVGGVQLSARESEILRMLRSGLTTAEVGDFFPLARDRSPARLCRRCQAGGRRSPRGDPGDRARCGLRRESQAGLCLHARLHRYAGPCPGSVLALGPPSSGQPVAHRIHGGLNAGCGPRAFRRCSSRAA